VFKGWKVEEKKRKKKKKKGYLFELPLLPSKIHPPTLLPLKLQFTD